MPVIGSMDTAAKLIYLATGVRSYHPVTDLYHEVRALRRTDESLRKFPVMVTAAGNVPKGGGKFTPRYAVLRDGWRVVPENVSHTLAITGEQLTEEGGAGPDCMDLSPLSASSKVIIQYEPPAAEIITVSTGGTFTADDRAKLEFMHKLDKNKLHMDIDAQQLVLYDDDGVTVLQRWNLSTCDGEPIGRHYGVQTKRGGPLL